MRTLLVVAAAAMCLCAACTSPGGTLPQASPPPTTPGTGRVAERALLDAASLPGGFRDQLVDVGDRWGEIIDESRDALSLRPDCQEPLGAAADELNDQAGQTAGAAFDNGADSDIRQFVGVVPSGVGAALVDQVRATYAECDSFSVIEPEGGSIDLTVAVVNPAGLDVPPGAHVVLWRRTLLSSVITTVEYRAFYSYRSVVGALAFEGRHTPAEVTMVVTDALDQARRAVS